MGQLAQPQPGPPPELEDYFPTDDNMMTSPVPRRPLVASQRASFCGKVDFHSSPQHPKGLMRKTSFRSPIVVQKSPDGSAATGSDPRGSGGADPLRVKAKAYESLKSQGSTGSTGSKNSTASTSSVVLLDMEEAPGADPDVFNPTMSFVSPKAGVYRPVNNGSSAAAIAKVKDKDKCVLM